MKSMFILSLLGKYSEEKSRFKIFSLLAFGVVAMQSKTYLGKLRTFLIIHIREGLKKIGKKWNFPT